MGERMRAVVALASVALLIGAPSLLILSDIEVRLGAALLLTIPGVVGLSISFGPLAGVTAAIGATFINDKLFFGEGITDERTAASLLVGPLLAAIVGTYSSKVQEMREEARLRAKEHARTLQADASRVALLATLSHDMKTPLATIKTVVSALTADRAEWTPDTSREALSLVETQTDRLTNLVSNLLDMSRLQAGVLALTPEPTDATEVIREASAAAGVTPEYDLEPSLPLVIADGYLLQRVVTNLLLNVSRHAGHDAAARVTARQSAGGVRIDIEDDGGAPDRLSESLAVPRQRNRQSPASAEPGDVLNDSDDSAAERGARGLAVCQALMTAMGGTMEIATSPLGGWRVTLRLPAMPDDDTLDPVDGERPGHPASMPIRRGTTSDTTDTTAKQEAAS